VRHHGKGGAVLVNTFEMVKAKDLDVLMAAVDDAVLMYKMSLESALAANAIGDTEFAILVSTLETMEPANRPTHMKAVLDDKGKGDDAKAGANGGGGGLAVKFEQARTLLGLVEESFDSIEMACYLHGRCIEQAAKTALLDLLSAGDRQVVEEKIAENKKRVTK